MAERAIMAPFLPCCPEKPTNAPTSPRLLEHRGGGRVAAMINPFTHRKILKNGTPGSATIVAMSMPDRGASKQNIAMTLQVMVEGLAPYEVEDQWMVSSKDTLGYGIQLPVKVDPDKPQRVAIDWEAARSRHADATAARRATLAAQGPVGSAAVQDPLAGGMAALAGSGMVGMASGMQGVTPTIDLRNDPELRAKLEQVLGRELTPGTSEHIDTSSDPALAMQIMQVVQQHQLEKMAGAGSPREAGDGSDDALSKLERLAKLRDSGALTDAEFEAEKKQLLGEI
jgi:hypothetical protein